jgi:hypothetical protein
VDKVTRFIWLGYNYDYAGVMFYQLDTDDVLHFLDNCDLRRFQSV